MHCVIVIVNYRTHDLVIGCLTSLRNCSKCDRAGVIIVENASNDGSAERISETINTRGWGGWARLVESPVNGGFSAGNNIGIRAAPDADAYLLLNSDTIVRPGAIAELCRAMREHPEAGLIGPRLEWPDGEAQVSCFRWPRLATPFLNAAATGPVTRALRRAEVAMPVSDEPMEPEWLSFAAVLIRREVIEQVGLLDEGYFMYFEDVDYCRRAREAGWKMLYWPESHIVHLRGGSSPVKSLTAQRKRRPQYYYASRSRYFAKFYGRTGLWMANAGWCAGRSISLVREFFERKPRAACEREWLDNWTQGWNPLGRNGAC